MVPFVLNAYGVACNHAGESLAHTTVRVPAAASFHELFANVNVGAVISFRIIYVFEFVGHHHISLILIITFVVPAEGVNVNDKLFALFVQLDHQLVEYAVAVLGE